jgi:hypothetical protein
MARTTVIRKRRTTPTIPTIRAARPTDHRGRSVPT